MYGVPPGARQAVQTMTKLVDCVNKVVDKTNSLSISSKVSLNNSSGAACNVSPMLTSKGGGGWGIGEAIKGGLGHDSLLNKEPEGRVFLDSRLDLINPPENFVRVLLRLGVKPEDLFAVVDGYYFLEGDDGLTIVPRVVGYPDGEVEFKTHGKFNPYLRFRSCLASASRTLKILKQLARKKNKIGFTQIVLTFPKEFSEDLPLSIDAKVKYAWKIFRKFRKKFEEWLNPNKVKGKIAYTVNLHIWSSEEPWRLHFHFHVLLVCAYIDDFGNVIRAKPNLDKWKLNELWTRHLHSNGIGLDYEHIDTWIGFRPGETFIYIEEENFPKILHVLKYVRRSWVYDFALWCAKNPGNEVKPELDFLLKEFLNYKNRTRVYGRWKDLAKKVSKEEDVVIDPITGKDVKLKGIRHLIPPKVKDLAVYVGERGNVRLIGYVSSSSFEDLMIKLNQRIYNRVGRLQKLKGKLTKIS